MVFLWRVIGETVQGVSHQKQGKQRQDAWRMSENKDYLIVAIADGHGDPKYPFSRDGAEMAVYVAVDQLLRFWRDLKANPVRDIKRLAEDTLPKSITRKWRIDVLVDYRRRSGKNEEEDIFSLYGTTLLAVLVTEKFAVQVQLGDGDIVNLYHSDSCEEVRRVFELSEDYLGTETDSLSQKNAEKMFKTSYESLIESDLGLIFLATDGYSDSFPKTSSAGFFKAVKDFWHYLTEEGPDFMKNELKVWLKMTSQNGSGDDITVILIYNKDFIHEVK